MALGGFPPARAPTTSRSCQPSLLHLSLLLATVPVTLACPHMLYRLRVFPPALSFAFPTINYGLAWFFPSLSSSFCTLFFLVVLCLCIQRSLYMFLLSLPLECSHHLQVQFLPHLHHRAAKGLHRSPPPAQKSGAKTTNQTTKVTNDPPMTNMTLVLFMNCLDLYLIARKRNHTNVSSLY